MSALIAIFSLGLLAMLVYWFWTGSARNTAWDQVFWPALGFKLLCGLILGWFYKGGFDTFSYQRGATFLSGIALEDPVHYFRVIFYNDLPRQGIIAYQTFSNSFFFIKILSLLNFLTGSNYYINSLFLSFYSFAGCWLLVKTLAKIFRSSSVAAIIAFLFIPSVTFWNSGVTKESVLLGSLCFFWALVLKTVSLKPQKVWIPAILLILMSWLLWKIKIFIAVVVFGLTAVWVFMRWARRKFTFLRSVWASVIVLVAGSTLISLFLSFLSRPYSLNFFFKHLVWNYQTLAKFSAGKPMLHFSNLEPDLLSVMWYAPQAFFGTLFRPFIWEGENVWYRLAGAENIILFVLILGSLPVFWQLKELKVSGFFLVLVTFVLIMAILLGLTTPNLGTLNRYRTIFLPFLVFLILQAPVWRSFLLRCRLKSVPPVA